MNTENDYPLTLGTLQRLFESHGLRVVCRLYTRQTDTTLEVLDTGAEQGESFMTTLPILLAHRRQGIMPYRGAMRIHPGKNPIATFPPEMARRKLVFCLMRMRYRRVGELGNFPGAF